MIGGNVCGWRLPGWKLVHSPRRRGLWSQSIWKTRTIQKRSCCSVWQLGGAAIPILRPICWTRRRVAPPPQLIRRRIWCGCSRRQTISALSNSISVRRWCWCRTTRGYWWHWHRGCSTEETTSGPGRCLKRPCGSTRRFLPHNWAWQPLKQNKALSRQRSNGYAISSLEAAAARQQLVILPQCWAYKGCSTKHCICSNMQPVPPLTTYNYRSTREWRC